MNEQSDDPLHPAPDSPAGEARPLRVMIVDDHRIFRQALARSLADHPDILVIAEAGDGIEALARAATAAPEVVCMDISMPRMNGIEATRQLLAQQPLVKIIGLSAYSEQRLVLDMVQAGAAGYINKADAAVELPAAIRMVCAGRRYLGSSAASVLAEHDDGREQ